MAALFSRDNRTTYNQVQESTSKLLNAEDWLGYVCPLLLKYYTTIMDLVLAKI